MNGYTQPSLSDLHRLIVAYGGGFTQYLDGKTTATHIIASNLTPKKVVEFRKYRIVKPAWIVDSVSSGRCLPWDAYRVIDEGAGQKILRLNEGNIVSQVNNHSTGYRDQSDTSWYTSQLSGLDYGTAEQIPRQLLTPFASSEPSCKVASESHKEVDLHEDSGHESGDGYDILQDIDLEATAQEPNVLEALNQSSVILEDTLEEQDSVASLDGKKNLPAVTASLPGPQLLTDEAVLHDIDEELFASLDNIDEIPEAVLISPKLLKRKLSDSSTSPPAKHAKVTAEEHNTALLSDPRIRKLSTSNPDFLEQYYRESRLHHLSAWKANLKSQLQALAAEKSASPKIRPKHVSGARRYILHVDFDSFFVAVSLKNCPQFVDKPTVVAHGGGSGSEIASCNYPARKFGVKNGMWMKRAQELCDHLKVLPYDFPAYEAASRLFYEAILATGGIVQSVSIDEALVDITALCLSAGGTDGTSVRDDSIWLEQAKADQIAEHVRDQVQEQTGCAVSVGIGGNILLAKVALRKAKPAGQYHVKPEEVLDFLADLDVQDLPGVASSIGGKLEEIGLKFIRDIRDVSKEKLISVLGPKTGEKIWNYARGIDRTEVGDQVVRKSVSAEVNWGVRFETQEQAEEFVESLCGELNRRLLKENVRGKQMTMKIMRRATDAPLDPPKHLGHGKCDTFNKSVVLGVATNAKDVLTKEALSILRGYGFSAGELRGLGVQMTKLEPLKTRTHGILDGSQRRLDFTLDAVATVINTNSANGKASKTVLDGNVESSHKPPQFVTEDKLASGDKVLHDPIQDDPEKPEKPRASLSEPHSLPKILNNTGGPSRKPLNTHGTQFILPTQIDSQVLAELPPDIRSKLRKHNRTSAEVDEGQTKESSTTQFILPTQVDPQVLAQLPPDIRSRLAKHIRTTTEVSPAEPHESKRKALLPITAFQNQSQLDPQILEALPADVRAEIMAQYERSPRKLLGQSLLPQSPRKNRTLPLSRKLVSTRGRGRGNSLLSRLRGSTRGNTPTLTQSNFVATTRAGSEPLGHASANNESAVEISSEFLAALPDDIRQEVLEQRRRDQLKRKAGIEVAQRRRVHRPPQQDYGGDTGQGERHFKLPPRPPRPTFTTKKLSSLEDLREAMSLWYEEFKEEGPYGEDVDALGRYLTSVVQEEGDMGKAVSVVKWLVWVMEGSSQVPIDARWISALDRIREFVRKAVMGRGLGNVDL